MSITGEILSYYETLGIQRDSNFAEILRAFKQRSLATHPTRNPNDLTVNTVKFREVCEAFDVLSQRKCPTVTPLSCFASGAASNLRQIWRLRPQRRRDGGRKALRRRLLSEGLA